MKKEEKEREKTTRIHNRRRISKGLPRTEEARGGRGAPQECSQGRRRRVDGCDVCILGHV